MSRTIRPDIHARFLRVLARALAREDAGPPTKRRKLPATLFGVPPKDAKGRRVPPHHAADGDPGPSWDTAVGREEEGGT